MLDRRRRALGTLGLAAALVLAGGAGAPVSLAAQGRPFAADPALADLPDRWSGLMDLFDVPGAAVAVVKDGQVFVHTVGVREPDTGRPVTPETMFYIASITKTFNATAVGTLVDQGRLSLEDRVRDHLPRLQLPDPELTETLTVGDLLSHRPGIRSGPVVLLDAFSGEITDDRYYHWLARGEVEGSLRYSNIHYTLLGRVIESVTGTDWRDYLQASVLASAGLRRTTGYASVLYADADAATPMTRAGDGSWTAVRQRKTDRTMHAAGGLGTSALDAARYLALHLGDGAIDDVRVVSAQFMQQMRAVRARHDEPEGSIRIMEGFGLGWQVGTYTGGSALCAHGGGYDGAAAWFALLPDRSAGIAILINAGGMARGWGDIVAIDLLERLTGEAPPWRPFDSYPQRAREMKAARQKEPAGDESGRLDPGSLSRPRGEYAGWFHHEDLGTLIVESHDNGLAFRLGDAPLPASPLDAADGFTLAGQFDPPVTCRFVVAAGGEVDAIRLTDADLGEFVFER